MTTPIYLDMETYGGVTRVLKVFTPEEMQERYANPKGLSHAAWLKETLGHLYEVPKRVPTAKLPRMTDPLGKHWGQPAGLRDRVVLYETHATISERDWLALARYESSYPSGVYPGKVWRRGPWLCWYGHEGTNPDGSKFVYNGHLRALVQ